MATYLNVPFRERAEAKTRGARWDGAARKWFVPAGRDLAPFEPWLPDDPSRRPAASPSDPTHGISLSQLLAGVAMAVEQVFRQGVWTAAEIVRLDGDPHVYLELAERDAAGILIAKARAIVWARDVAQVLGTFQTATGVRLAAGVKVLVRARPEFSAQYGLTLHVDAIDPAYTLGDLEAVKRRIRERLQAEGIFEHNRQLPPPFDYRSLLVVSPARAAGLGDFAREADRLQRAGVCEATYVHSRFEGEGAAASIRGAAEAALAAWSARDLPEAIVVIRGGGAVNDLAWLNDYDLARFVCLSPIPVLTGIGHERDSTLLDEVAHRRFDTPSKVIAGIEALIVKRARESQALGDEIAARTLRDLRSTRAVVGDLAAAVRRQTASTLAAATARVQENWRAVETEARLGLGAARQSTAARCADVRTEARVGLATASATVGGLEAQVRAEAVQGLRATRRLVDQRRGDVVARAGEAVDRREERVRALVGEVARAARQSLRLGAEAAAATFREVVAQGPEKTLGRGFAVVHDPNGRLLADAASARRSSELRIRFQDGSVDAAIGTRRPRKKALKASDHP